MRTRINVLLLAVALLAGCGAEPATQGPADDEGTITAALVVPGGVGNLTQVNWSLLQNGSPVVPAVGNQILLGAASSTTKPTVTVFIKTGSNYAIQMTATTSMSVACSGTSSTFSITAGGTANVMLSLACGGAGPAPTGGRANVTATVGGGDSCPNLSYLDISPTSLLVGDTAILDSMAVDPDAGDTISYQWTSTSGMFISGAATRTATWKCTTTGTFNVTLTFSDVTTLLNPCAPQTVVTAMTCL
jgi:hypothetical protein